MTSTAYCEARTKAGAPCRAFAVDGSRFCWAHDPDLAEKRKLARKAGGRARHGRDLSASEEGLALASVSDVCALLERTARDLLALENSISRARAVSQLCGVALKALELEDLADRISRLEDHLGI